MGQMLEQVFEALQMNEKLKGNIFVHDSSCLGELAEDCWFKKTWELCHRFKVALIIHESHDMPKIRQRDKALMEFFIDCGVYNIRELAVLNRVRTYKQTHPLANILWCNRKKLLTQRFSGLNRQRLLVHGSFPLSNQQRRIKTYCNKPCMQLLHQTE